MFFFLSFALLLWSTSFAEEKDFKRQACENFIALEAPISIVVPSLSSAIDVSCVASDSAVAACKMTTGCLGRSADPQLHHPLAIANGQMIGLFGLMHCWWVISDILAAQHCMIVRKNGG